jgi:hypothetical protein
MSMTLYFCILALFCWLSANLNFYLYDKTKNKYYIVVAKIMMACVAVDCVGALIFISINASNPK